MPAEPQRFDPERILEVLDRHGVDYVMVGGFASQLHGARRQTYDIDFVPSATEANDDRLASALRELGARLRVAGLTDEEARQLPVTIDAATLRAFGSTTSTTDAGPLDVLRKLPVPKQTHTERDGDSTTRSWCRRCVVHRVPGGGDSAAIPVLIRREPSSPVSA